jgi:hypothetical protein
MKRLFAATLVASALAGFPASFGIANTWEECGPGCHSTVNGACVVNGWEAGLARWNECPAGSRPHPPCGVGYAWRPRLHACFQK